MSERYSISPSLLNAWAYIYKSFDGYEQKAYDDFVRALQRIKSEPTVAMLKGIEFENVVNFICHNGYHQNHKYWACKCWYEEIVVRGGMDGIHASEPCQYCDCPPKPSQLHFKIAEIVTGGVQQVELKKKVTIDGTEFLLVGYADYIKEGVIYDIKTTKSYDVGKYFDSLQHAVYMYICQDAYKFEYLISDGKDVYREKYDRKCVERVEREIREFVRFLKNADLWELFKKHRMVNDKQIIQDVSKR